MSAGKGSSPRSCFSKEFRENWEGIFGKKLTRSRGAAEEEKKDRSVKSLTPRLCASAGEPSGRSVSPYPEQ